MPHKTFTLTLATDEGEVVSQWVLSGTDPEADYALPMDDFDGEALVSDINDDTKKASAE